MPPETILIRLRALLDELLESGNFVLAGTVRDAIAMMEADLGGDAGGDPAVGRRPEDQATDYAARSRYQAP